MANEHDRPAERPQEVGKVRGVTGEIAQRVAKPDDGVPTLLQGADLRLPAGRVGPRTVDQDDRR